MTNPETRPDGGGCPPCAALLTTVLHAQATAIAALRSADPTLPKSEARAHTCIALLESVITQVLLGYQGSVRETTEFLLAVMQEVFTCAGIQASITIGTPDEMRAQLARDEMPSVARPLVDRN